MKNFLRSRTALGIGPCLVLLGVLLMGCQPTTTTYAPDYGNIQVTVWANGPQDQVKKLGFSIRYAWLQPGPQDRTDTSGRQIQAGSALPGILWQDTFPHTPDRYGFEVGVAVFMSAPPHKDVVLRCEVAIVGHASGLLDSSTVQTSKPGGNITCQILGINHKK